MSKAIEALQAFLNDRKWEYKACDKSSLRGTVASDCGRWTWYAYADTESEFLQFCGTVAINIPAARRILVAEYITRANWELNIGHFGMDSSDGEIRYQTTLVLDRRRAPTVRQLEHLVLANRWALDRYVPGLMSVVYGNTTPEQAVADADADADADEDPPEETEEATAPEERSSRKPLRRLPPGEN